MTISLTQYTIQYVLKPFILNTGFLLLAIFAMRVRFSTTIPRIYLLSVALIGVCFVFYSVHYIFHIAIVFCEPILFTAFYGNYLLTSVVTGATLAAKLLADFFIFWDNNRLPPFDSGLTIMRIVVSTMLLCFFYAISMVVIYFQRKKNNAVIQKEQERKEMEKQLLTDPLTGIYNRIALQNQLQTIENTASESIFFAMLDLDSFKQLNDTLGHPKGDQCLELIGQVLQEFHSETVTPFRFGGDEFWLLFNDHSHNEVLTICTRIREIVRKSVHHSFGVPLTVSIGIARHTKEMLAEDLVQEADIALYRAKKKKDIIAF